MTDSLPACAKNHPGAASQITVSHGVNAHGTTFERRVCTLCSSISAKANHKDRAEAARRGVESPVALVKYGVVKLDWKAPEYCAREVGVK